PHGKHIRDAVATSAPYAARKLGKSGIPVLARVVRGVQELLLLILGGIRW
ncbi:hypothetical protein PF007_g28111, partial [Phytophthora fragariae]